jgi:hypothetical protein
MNEHEANDLLNQALEQIADTTEAVINWRELTEGALTMKANEDAPIYQHLRESFRGILEPNVYPTLFDPQAHKKSIALGRFTLEVTVTHREPTLEKLKGVDVYYNLLDWKGLAFQHKKRAKDGTLKFSTKEREQREKIERLCGRCKVLKKQDDKGFLRANCSSLYVVSDKSDATRHVISACRVEDYKRAYPNGSHSPLPKLPAPSDLHTADRMFLQCLIGRLLKGPQDRIDMELMRDAFLMNPDLLIEASLRERRREG